MLAAIAVVLLLSGAAVASYLKGIDKRLQQNMGSAVSEVLVEPKKPSEPFYMLLMGSDRRPGETVARADTLIVARVDAEEKRVTLLSIPRDTRVAIPGHSTNKVNAAMVYGGPELAIQTISEFTGLPITHYLEIDFAGFAELVDAIGGVTLEVPEEIDDLKAANYVEQFRYVPEGTQRLNGGQALTFVRSRDFPEGDLRRIQNQQTFLRALAEELLEIQNVLRLRSIVDVVVDNVKTDMSVSRILSLANEFRGMDPGAIEAVTMPGTPEYIGRVSYVIADEDALGELIARIDQGLPADPTEAEAGVADLDPSSVRVVVRNGAGIGGVAADAAGRLQVEGFQVIETGNANQFVYDETLVVYKNDAEKATAVLRALGIGRVVPSSGMYSFEGDVLVVVGKDWEPPATSQ